MKNSYDIVIIGGGIAACSAAYHLSLGGHGDIALIEMGHIGGGATGQSAAMVLQQTGHEVLTRLAQISVADYNMYAQQAGYPVRMETTGSILYTTRQEGTGRVRDLSDMQHRLGLESHLVDADEIRSLFPQLNTTDIALGSYCPSDGFVNAFEVMQFYLKGARERGLDVLERTTVTGIETVPEGKRTRIRAVKIERRTEEGIEKHELRTFAVINAAGAFSSTVARWVGIKLPIKCNRRHLVIARPEKPLYSFPIIEDIDDEWYLRPAGEKNVLVGVGPVDSREPPSVCRVQDVPRDHSVLKLVSKYLSHRVPGLGSTLYPRYWAGLRGMTADELPIVGKDGDVLGFVYCAGMSAFGITNAPACGRLVASLFDSDEGGAPVDLLPWLALHRLSIERPSSEATADQLAVHR